MLGMTDVLVRWGNKLEHFCSDRGWVCIPVLKLVQYVCKLHNIYLAIIYDEACTSLCSQLRLTS